VVGGHSSEAKLEPAASAPRLGGNAHVQYAAVPQGDGDGDEEELALATAINDEEGQNPSLILLSDSGDSEGVESGRYSSDSDDASMNGAASAPRRVTWADEVASNRNEDRSKLLVCRPVVMSAIVLYTLTSMVKVMSDEAFPTWVQTPVKDRGLGLSAAHTGTLMAINGCLMLVFQLTGFVWLRNYFSQLGLLTCSTFAKVIGFMVIPLISLLAAVGRGLDEYTEPDASIQAATGNSSEPAAMNGNSTSMPLIESPPRTWKGVVIFWIPTALFLFFSAAMGLAQFITVALTINNTVVAKERGAVNGLAMTIASIGKALGPAIGGALLAYSLNQAAESPSDAWRVWPLSFWTVFNTSAILMFFVGVGIMYLPAHLEHPPNEDNHGSTVSPRNRK